jgi:hypothetical protein
MAVRVRALALAICLAVVAAGAIPGLEGAPAARGAGEEEVPGLAWTELMPPLPGPGGEPKRRVANCEEPSPACVRRVIERLRERRDRWGCDHRAVFATTYLVLTRQIMRDIRSGWVARNFRFPRYLYREDALFANVYFRVIRAWRRGDPVPGAWRVAFEAAGDGDKAASQDMLLGINAHVQNDMPFVLAALGLRVRGGSVKPDHDAGNGPLNRAYDDVVAAVRRRYDASLDLTNPDLIPLDDVAGLELVREWREQVWRNAERLVGAETRAERRQVARDIESYAEGYANVIASGGIPGYGAERHAYCAAGPAGSGR